MTCLLKKLIYLFSVMCHVTQMSHVNISYLHSMECNFSKYQSLPHDAHMLSHKKLAVLLAVMRVIFY